jgi:uncharacterized protein YodC (DUF2158 family)
VLRIHLKEGFSLPLWSATRYLQKKGTIMAGDFQDGDTVRLKSGGPLMTIESLGVEHQGGTTQGAWCVWFEKIKGKQQKQMAWFAFTTLNKENPNQEFGFYPSRSIMD